MKPLSIRSKVAVYAATLTTIALLVFASGTLVNVYEENIEAADLELRAVGQRVTQMHEAGISLREEAIEAEVGFGPNITTALFDGQGQLHLGTGGMPEVVARAAATREAIGTITDGPGKHRVAVFGLGHEILVVAYDLHEIHEITVDLLSAYLLSLPLVAGIVGLGAWVLAGRALKPLQELTLAAAAVTSARLDSRVPVPASHDEVARLASVLNTMLARLETSFRQAERFAADASHELRTPLTVMRGEIDRALHQHDLPGDLETHLVSLQEEVVRLERICESLLLLARIDAGRLAIGPAVVDFSALGRELCEDAEMLGATRDVRIESEIADGVRVQGDADLLRRVLLNLVDNGTKFNERNGRLHCQLRAERDHVIVRIANTGPAISAEDRPRIFDRFHRVDLARQRGGHGLGLSLAREIAGAHGGSLDLVESAEPGWTVFELTLPLAR